MTINKVKKVGVALVMALITIIGAYFLTSNTPKESHVSAETFTSGPTQDFINQIAGTASQIAAERDLYASVMIAQAILESSNGQSGLSQAPYYNFFGIKGSYNGASVNMTTWEDDGQGNPYEIDQHFHAYPSIADSLYDYAALLNAPIYAGARRSNTLSYQDATAALTGLYATDTAYNAKLNNIIQTYGLTAYDVVAPVAPTAVSQEEIGAVEQGSQIGLVNTSGQLVWNKYRSRHTDSATLSQDEAWSVLTRGY